MFQRHLLFQTQKTLIISRTKSTEAITTSCLTFDKAKNEHATRLLVFLLKKITYVEKWKRRWQ